MFHKLPGCLPATWVIGFTSQHDFAMDLKLLNIYKTLNYKTLALLTDSTVIANNSIFSTKKYISYHTVISEVSSSNLFCRKKRIFFIWSLYCPQMYCHQMYCHQMYCHQTVTSQKSSPNWEHSLTERTRVTWTIRSIFSNKLFLNEDSFQDFLQKILHWFHSIKTKTTMLIKTDEE